MAVAPTLRTARRRKLQSEDFYLTSESVWSAFSEVAHEPAEADEGQDLQEETSK